MGNVLLAIDCTWNMQRTFNLFQIPLGYFNQHNVRSILCLFRWVAWQLCGFVSVEPWQNITCSTMRMRAWSWMIADQIGWEGVKLTYRKHSRDNLKGSRFWWPVTGQQYGPSNKLCRHLLHVDFHHYIDCDSTQKDQRASEQKYLSISSMEVDEIYWLLYDKTTRWIKRISNELLKILTSSVAILRV